MFWNDQLEKVFLTTHGYYWIVEEVILLSVNKIYSICHFPVFQNILLRTSNILKLAKKINLSPVVDRGHLFQCYESTFRNFKSFRTHLLTSQIWSLSWPYIWWGFFCSFFFFFFENKLEFAEALILILDRVKFHVCNSFLSRIK